MVSPIGYGSYNSYINSYFTGRNQGSGPVNAISPINRVRPANSSTLLPLDTPQQARLTTALRDVRNMFSQLKTAATSLQLGKTGNVFDKRIVDTTNSAAVTATAKDKAKQTDYAIGVSKLAQSQQNRGTAFEATSNASVAGFTVGENKFLLTHGTTSTQLSFTVKAGDNTKTTLSNMASSINNAKTGVTAQLMNSTVDGITNSRLVLTGDKTGTDNAFSLTDETGNAVAKSGAGVRSTEAANAQYSVNNLIPLQASEIPQLSQYRYNNMSAMISQMYSVGNLVDGYM